MRIRKALFAVAGYGTRFLPITKTIQKEMLSILDRPVVDYAVEDCIKGGIEEIIFVISPRNKQIKDFYTRNEHLEKYLHEKGKDVLAEKIQHLHTQCSYKFIEQPDDAPYGTATPVKLAKDLLKDEDGFMVIMGDNFVFNKDGSSDAKKMIELFNTSNAAGLTACIERPENELHKYGIARTRQENGFDFLIDFTEKPAPGTAPSNLACISQYIFTSEIFDILENQAINSTHKEFQITDSCTQLAANKKVVVYKPSGVYLDAGSKLGWLKANITLALHDPEMSEEIKALFSI